MDNETLYGITSLRKFAGDTVYIGTYMTTIEVESCDPAVCSIYVYGEVDAEVTFYYYPVSVTVEISEINVSINDMPIPAFNSTIQQTLQDSYDAFPELQDEILGVVGNYLEEQKAMDKIRTEYN